MRTRKFEPGHIVVTCAVDNWTNGQKDPLKAKFLSDSLGRHITGDWGDISYDDKFRNEAGLIGEGGRLRSSYTDTAGTVICITTEGDRSITCIQFPNE